MTTTYKFKAYYKKDGVGATQNPAPVCTVINMADDSKLADAQATIASTNMPGLYSYSYTGNDGLDLVAYFHTTDADADEADVASYVNDKITTNLNADVAGVEAKIDTINGTVDAILEDTGTTIPATLATIDDYIDTEVAAIKAKTDNLPAIPAPAGEYDAELAAIQADLNNPDQYKADISALAKTTHVQEIEDKVDAIKLKTDNIPANPATAGEYTASLAAIQSDVSGIPDAILTKAIVDTLTVEQVLKVLAAVETGITTGGGTDTIVYTGKDGTEIRLTGVDEDGNRSTVIVIPGA